jgi:hypothetical protein
LITLPFISLFPPISSSSFSLLLFFTFLFYWKTFKHHVFLFDLISLRTPGSTPDRFLIITVNLLLALRPKVSRLGRSGLLQKLNDDCWLPASSWMSTVHGIINDRMFPPLAWTTLLQTLFLFHSQQQQQNLGKHMILKHGHDSGQERTRKPSQASTSGHSLPLM